jgi:hypothetical protein
VACTGTYSCTPVLPDRNNIACSASATTRLWSWLKLPRSTFF